MTDLRIYNTLSGVVEEFRPLEPGKVRMYVCGPTVYDDAHLGHARCYITWDVLYRFLKFLGYDVTYVRNVTDVDDKILHRAAERGETPETVARRNYDSFAADMKALNVLTPDAEPRATEYIPDMIRAIEVLIDKGAAYVTPEGTVYYRVGVNPHYGELSKKPLEDLRAGARVEVDPHKESPLDFALWKHVSAEEYDKPGHAYESPWGKGRPGWHIECSAMNHAILGPQIDIHAGGADLIFPHHENEIAQSEVWTGKRPFARYWMHNGFVNVSGEKMSKSLGNFSTVKALLARYDANTIRYFLLTNHYRMPVDFNAEALDAAENWAISRHRRLREACQRLGLPDAEAITRWLGSIHGADPQVLARFREAMADDLNTAKALVLLNELLAGLDASNGHGNEALAGALASAVQVFMALGFSVDLLFQAVTLPAEEIRTIYKEMTGRWLEADREPQALLSEIVAMRKEAKATRNWTQADAIRKHLADIGFQVLDNKDGTTSLEKDGREIVRV